MFENSDHSDFDATTCKVYDAYNDLIINQHEFRCYSHMNVFGNQKVQKKVSCYLAMQMNNAQ